MEATALCPCLSPDPAIARAARREMKSMLIDESHLIVSIQNCVECGQAFLSVFTEQVDWLGGDDAQAQVLVPLTADEEHCVAGMTEVTEQALLSLQLKKSMLWWVYPTGQDPKGSWKDGPLVILPHD